MTALLITGSRFIDPKALVYLEKVLDRVKELGWSVIVGDAEGVDAMVIYGCHKRDIPTIVHGANGKLRRYEDGQSIVVIDENYLARDRYMADRADRVLAIWNGSSRGTKYTFEYAQRIGKQVDVRIFS